MKILILAATLAVNLYLCQAPALAQEDDGTVIAAFQLYNNAIDAGDADAIHEYAKLAYDRAMAEWGTDDVQTGYLAANYAETLLNRGDLETAKTIYYECVEILTAYSPDTAIDLASCHYYIGLLELRSDNARRSRQAFQAVIDLFPLVENEPYMRRIAGEAYLGLARDAVPGYIRLRELNDDESRRFQRTLDYALAALPLLTETFGAESQQMATAYMLIAIYHEFARDWQSAYEYYHRAHTIYFTLNGEEDGNTREAYGRARYSVSRGENVETKPMPPHGDVDHSPDELEDTLPELPEDCYWMWKLGEAYRICPVKREPPRYPHVAGMRGQFGYVEVRYDITEEGTTDNISVYTAWPENAFDDEVIDAVSDWRYEPVQNSEGEIVRLPEFKSWMLFEIRN